jgi:hypothetical protein
VPVRVAMPLLAGPDSVTDAQISVYGLTRVNVGDSQAMLHFTPEGAIIRDAAVVAPRTSAPPGGTFIWDFTVTGDDGSADVGFAAQSSGGNLTWQDLDRTWLKSQLDPGQRVPSGPIGNSMTLQADRVSPGRWQMVVPLARSAAPRRYLEFDVVDVAGAYYPQRAGLLGTVAAQ